MENAYRQMQMNAQAEKSSENHRRKQQQYITET